MAVLCRRQGGAVSRAQLLAHGIDDDRIHRFARQGWLVRVRQGIYRVGTLTPDGVLWAALPAMGPQAALTHRTRFTTVSRTLLDLAAELPEPQRQAAVDEARVRRRLHRPSTEPTIARAPGHHGIGPLRRAIARHDRGRGVPIGAFERRDRLSARPVTSRRTFATTRSRSTASPTRSTSRGPTTASDSSSTVERFTTTTRRSRRTAAAAGASAASAGTSSGAPGSISTSGRPSSRRTSGRCCSRAE